VVGNWETGRPSAAASRTLISKSLAFFAASSMLGIQCSLALDRVVKVTLGRGISSSDYEKGLSGR